MTVARNGAQFVVGINHDAQENSCRPAVDVLFRSVAQTYGANVLAVGPTGIGREGPCGGAAQTEAGGERSAQNEASPVVWGRTGRPPAASRGRVDNTLNAN